MAVSLAIVVLVLFLYLCLHPEAAQDYIDFIKKVPLTILVCGTLILVVFFIPSIRKTLRHRDL